MDSQCRNERHSGFRLSRLAFLMERNFQSEAISVSGTELEAEEEGLKGARERNVQARTHLSLVSITSASWRAPLPVVPGKRAAFRFLKVVE